MTDTVVEPVVVPPIALATTHQSELEILLADGKALLEKIDAALVADLGITTKETSLVKGKLQSIRNALNNGVTELEEAVHWIVAHIKKL